MKEVLQYALAKYEITENQKQKARNRISISLSFYEDSSGLHYVNTGGKTMFQMKGTSNYIGSLKSAAGTVGGGQAQMMPFACAPIMLFIADVLAGIDKKLDAISEVQKEMMDFLVQKEKAELKILFYREQIMTVCFRRGRKNLQSMKYRLHISTY